MKPADASPGPRREEAPSASDPIGWLMPAVAASAEGIALTTTAGEIVWANPSWAAAHALAPETATGRRIAEFHSSRALAPVLAYAVERGEHEGELEHLRADGTRFSSWTSVRLVRRENLAEERLVWVVRDRTERDRASRTLQDLGKRFRAVVQSARDAIVVVDAERRVLLWNAAAERLFGATDSAALGTSLDALFAEEDRARVAGEVASLIAHPTRGAEGISSEATAVDRAGRRFPVEASFSAFASGRGRFASAILRDVTERKETEQRMRDALVRARESDRLKSAFLDNVSHEIRTPINVISGMAEVLAERVRGARGVDVDEPLRALDRAAKRLVDSIGRTLDFAKLSAGGTVARPSRVRLADLVEEQIAAYEELAREKGIALVGEIPDPRLALFVDRLAIGCALANLVDNAVKFTERGRVCVRVVAPTAQAVAIEVEDTGIGIARDFRRRLFEPFAQEESGHARRYEGQGLGLAVARRYVSICGGEIEVESEKERGSLFRVRLPQERRPRVVGSPRIVVVARGGNDPTWREHVADRARLAFHDRIDGLLDRLGEGGERPSLLVLDLGLGPDVISCVRTLRGHAAWWDLAVVGYLADAHGVSRGRALAAGVDEVLPAPLDPARVLEALERWVD